MGKINIEDLDHYVNENGQRKEKTKFLSLKKDGEVVQVRFCHNSLADVEAITLHTIKDDQGVNRKVACLRAYNDPLDKCPFCKHLADNPNDKKIGPTQLRFFLTLAEYTKDADGKVTYEKKFWERGRTFRKELEGLTKRYSPLCKQVFEIERQGAPGDTATKYGIYPIPGDINDFPLTKTDLTNETAFGGVVANKTAEEMQQFIATGSFLRPRTSSAPTDNDVPPTTHVDSGEDDLPF